jgi:hypothetical protein
MKTTTSKPIPDCANRLPVGEHLFCAHPRVHIGWADNFLTVTPRGKTCEPNHCRNCPFAGPLAAKPRPVPAEFTPPKLRSFNGPAPSSTPKPIAGHCVHRGDELRRVECKPCGGKTQLKVFACAIHGECALSEKAAVKCCGNCTDRLAESPLQ